MVDSCPTRHTLYFTTVVWSLATKVRHLDTLGSSIDTLARRHRKGGICVATIINIALIYDIVVAEREVLKHRNPRCAVNLKALGNSCAERNLRGRTRDIDRTRKVIATLGYGSKVAIHNKVLLWLDILHAAAISCIKCCEV